MLRWAMRAARKELWVNTLSEVPFLLYEAATTQWASLALSFVVCAVGSWLGVHMAQRGH